MSAGGELPLRSQPSLPRDDDWLLPFLPELRRRGDRLLEIGCGPGRDAAFLSGSGFSVTAFDRQPVRDAARRAPEATFFRADLSRPLPFHNVAFDAAVASLSLHYLPWQETKEALAEIRRVLRPGSPFLFRVNATDDVNHGAGQGEPIEPNFYQAAPGSSADTKRFFDEASVRDVVSGSFAIEHLEHRTIHRYEQPKQVWECLATAI